MQNILLRLPICIILLSTGAFSHAQTKQIDSIDKQIRHNRYTIHVRHIAGGKTQNLTVSASEKVTRVDYVDADRKIVYSTFYGIGYIASLSPASDSREKTLTINSIDKEVIYLDYLTKPFSVPSCIMGRGLSNFKDGSITGDTYSVNLPDGTVITAKLDVKKDHVAEKIERRNDHLLNSVTLSNPVQIDNIWIMKNCEILNFPNPSANELYIIDKISKNTENESASIRLRKGDSVIDQRFTPSTRFIIGSDRIFEPEEIFEKSKKESEKLSRRINNNNSIWWYCTTGLISILLISKLIQSNKNTIWQ